MNKRVWKLIGGENFFFSFLVVSPTEGFSPVALKIWPIINKRKNAPTSWTFVILGHCWIVVWRVNFPGLPLMINQSIPYFFFFGHFTSVISQDVKQNPKTDIGWHFCELYLFLNQFSFNVCAASSTLHHHHLSLAQLCVGKIYIGFFFLFGKVLTIGATRWGKILKGCWLGCRVRTVYT